MDTGSRRIVQALHDVSGRFRKILPEALEAAARPMQEAAMAAAPVAAEGGGKLRDSIVAKVVVANPGAAILEVGPTGRERRSIGHLLEFGTRYQRPQPFLRPAFDATLEECLAVLSEEMRKAL